jgi:hypothetical protein
VDASKPLPARDAPEAMHQVGRFAVQPIHEE